MLHGPSSDLGQMPDPYENASQIVANATGRTRVSVKP